MTSFHSYFRTITIVGDQSIASFMAGPTSKKTIVLVHGIGVSHRYFDPLVKILATDYKVIALDLPGYGDSPQTEGTLSVETLADVLNTFLEQNEIDHPILVGHSMGCQVIGTLLQKYPQTARKAVLIGPTVNEKERTARQQALRLMQDVSREPLAVNLVVIQDYIKCGVRRYLKTVPYMLSSHLEYILPGVNIPVLVVRGNNDPIVPSAWAAMVSRAARGRLVEVPGAGHVVQFSHPKEVAGICVTFIND